MSIAELTLSGILDMAQPSLSKVRADVHTPAVQPWPCAIIKATLHVIGGPAPAKPCSIVEIPGRIGGNFLSMGMQAVVTSAMAIARNLIAHRGKAARHADAADMPALCD